jgi:ectoine hydroxylase-related dioxygenase (phytanoyl-CoA dioxygenase family)
MGDSIRMEPERHPLNTWFEWAPPRGPFRRISDAQARAYDVDGYFVLEDAVDPATVDSLLAEIDPVEEQVENFLRGLPDGKMFIARAGEITFSPHLVTRSARLRAFCAGPLFGDLVHDLIGPTVRLYWEQSVYKKPESPSDFPWHQDNGYTFIEPQQYLTCWLALTDATPENGCPWVVPGLHRHGTLRHWMTDLGWRCLDEAPGAVAVPVRAGSIAVFSSLTPHRTGPNRTDAVRKSYIVQFAPDGARRVQADGEAVRYEPCNDPERQFLVLNDGCQPDG